MGHTRVDGTERLLQGLRAGEALCKVGSVKRQAKQQHVAPEVMRQDAEIVREVAVSRGP